MSTVEPTPADRGLAGETRAVAVEGAARMSRAALDFLARYGAILAFVITVAVFSALKPDAFPTTQNWKDMLTQASILAIVSFGLTVPMVMNDFDLSFGAMIGLGGSMTVVLLSEQGIAWPLAALAAVGVAVGFGLLNGILVAYVGASSFIITLAAANVIAGVEIYLTDSQTIFQNISASFIELGQGEFLGVRYLIWIALGVAIVLWLLLSQSEVGRYMHAIGGNMEAARLTGIRVRELRLLGFVVAAVCGAIAGILLHAQAASSYPNSGPPFLLDAFAAVFLGSAMARDGRFNIPGTLVGVVFLQVITVGLIQQNLDAWVVEIATGAVLVFAILLSRLGRARS